MPVFSTPSDPAAIEALAVKLWGEPNRTLSSRDELRFGTNGSKSVRPRHGVYYDHEACEGGHYRDLYKLVNGTYPENGSDKSGFRVPDGMLRQLGNPVAWWDYHDEHGAVVARVVRFEPAGQAKTYRQCRPDGAGWVWKMERVQVPLYRLPALLRAPKGSLVYVVEGEKHADRLRQWGLIATTNAGGAGKFRSHHARALAGHTVVMLPDNDEAGWKHRDGVLSELRTAGVAAHVLDLPGLPDKGDVLDWIKAGGTPDQLARLTDALLRQPVETPLPLLWLDDIEPVLQAQDFVQGVLMQGGAAVIYGESNSGKTFWATDLALHVAQGKRWNDRRVDQGGVVYCVLEGGNGFRNRVSAWRRENITEPGLPFAAIPSAINLLDPDADTPRLIETVKAAAGRMSHPVRLIVVDTLSRAMAGGNENAPDDMGALVANMDRIRTETGACVVFIHHCGKDAAKGARGHSSLRAAIDTEIEVVAGDDARSATVVKQRDMEKGAVFAFALRAVTLGQNQHGEDVTTCTVEPSETAPAPRKDQLTTTERAWMRDLEQMFQAPDLAQLRKPFTSGFAELTLTRETIRNGLKDRGRFSCGPDANLTGADRERLRSMLNKLKDKGKIGMTSELVWLMAPRQVASGLRQP